MKRLKEKFVHLRPEERLYQSKIPLIGLTGGIATGKSTVAQMLKENGIKVIDADLLVKSIYSREDALAFVKENYPTAWLDEKINFKKLREIVFQSVADKQKVEQFIYQRLQKAFEETAMLIKDQSFLIYDVPLLFEKDLSQKMDLVLVVYAPIELQMERLLKRDSGTEETARNILNSQISIEDKKKKADIVIYNTGPKEKLYLEIDKLLKEIFIS